MLVLRFRRVPSQKDVLEAKDDDHSDNCDHHDPRVGLPFHPGKGGQHNGVQSDGGQQDPASRAHLRPQIAEHPQWISMSISK